MCPNEQAYWFWSNHEYGSHNWWFWYNESTLDIQVIPICTLKVGVLEFQNNVQCFRRRDRKHRNKHTKELHVRKTTHINLHRVTVRAIQYAYVRTKSTEHSSSTAPTGGKHNPVPFHNPGRSRPCITQGSHCHRLEWDFKLISQWFCCCRGQWDETGPFLSCREHVNFPPPFTDASSPALVIIHVALRYATDGINKKLDHSNAPSKLKACDHSTYYF